MSTKPRARLEKWTMYPFSHQLTGLVYGHPRRQVGGELDDGHFITTSTVLRISDDEKEAETLNTIYDLGEKRELPKSVLA